MVLAFSYHIWVPCSALNCNISFIKEKFHIAIDAFYKLWAEDNCVSIPSLWRIKSSFTPGNGILFSPITAFSDILFIDIRSTEISLPEPVLVNTYCLFRLLHKKTLGYILCWSSGVWKHGVVIIWNIASFLWSLTNQE